MANTVEITCKCGCGRKKQVRVADRKRGWGKYFSKSCKAKHQERQTGQYAAHLRGGDREIDDDIGHPFESGYFGHGQWGD